MEYIIIKKNNEDYLMHYGVPGMKWGVRKAQKLQTSDIRKRYDSLKSDYKSANKAYYKSSAYSLSKKKRQASAARWDQAAADAEKMVKAKKAYKQVKQERKQAIKNTYKDVNKNTKLSDKLVYNNATRKKAAKYIVDNNMTMAEATKRANSDARRNTALVLGVYGAVLVSSLYKNAH